MQDFSAIVRGLYCLHNLLCLIYEINKLCFHWGYWFSVYQNPPKKREVCVTAKCSYISGEVQVRPWHRVCIYIEPAMKIPCRFDAAGEIWLNALVYECVQIPAAGSSCGQKTDTRRVEAVRAAHVAGTFRCPLTFAMWWLCWWAKICNAIAGLLHCLLLCLNGEKGSVRNKNKPLSEHAVTHCSVTERIITDLFVYMWLRFTINGHFDQSAWCCVTCYRGRHMAELVINHKERLEAVEKK